LDADAHEAWNGLGCVYRDQERYDESVQAFREAIRLDPDFAPAHNGLGQTLAEIGRLDEAYDCFRKATACDPKLVSAWYNLAAHHRKRLTTEDIQQIKALLNTPWLKPTSQAGVYYALGGIFDAEREFAAATLALNAANQQQQLAWTRRGEVYETAEHQVFVDRIIDTFDADWFNRVAAGDGNQWGLDTDVPVLIVGMPRSGTTLTEQIIASHPAAYGLRSRRVELRA